MGEIGEHLVTMKLNSEQSSLFLELPNLALLRTLSNGGNSGPLGLVVSRSLMF